METQGANSGEQLTIPQEAPRLVDRWWLYLVIAVVLALFSATTLLGQTTSFFLALLAACFVPALVVASQLNSLRKKLGGSTPTDGGPSISAPTTDRMPSISAPTADRMPLISAVLAAAKLINLKLRFVMVAEAALVAVFLFGVLNFKRSELEWQSTEGTVRDSQLFWDLVNPPVFRLASASLGVQVPRSLTPDEVSYLTAPNSLNPINANAARKLMFRRLYIALLVWCVGLRLFSLWLELFSRSWLVRWLSAIAASALLGASVRLIFRLA